MKRKFALLGIAVLTMSIAMPVIAGNKASCATLAKVAQEVAIDRDAGRSRQEEIDTALAQHPSDYALHIIRVVIDSVYAGYYRDKSPSDTYNQVNQGCLAGGKGQ